MCGPVSRSSSRPNRPRSRSSLEQLPLGLSRRAVEDHPVALDPSISEQLSDMMPAVLAVALGQDDAVAADAVDRADMLLVGSDHGHMLADVAEQLALALAGRPPVREFTLEPALVLAAIFVIVAVERVDLPPAPLAVMRVVQSPDAIPVNSRLAAPLSQPFGPAALRRIAAVEPIFVAEGPAAGEAAGVGPAIAFVAEAGLRS